MSTIIEQVYASAGDQVIIDTLELICDAWEESVFIVKGYEDVTAGTEDGRIVTFIAAPMAIELPKKTNAPNQTLRFAIDNVTGQAQRLIDQAIESEQRITLCFRRYLDSDLTLPAEPPFYATVLSGGCTGTTVQLDAGFYDLLNYAWPRDTYTATFAPGLKYL